MPEDSIFFHLEKHLFKSYPEIRTTFFTVVGPISQYTRHQPFAFAEAIDYNDASIKFFRQLYADPRFEIAYHGWNHGIPGKITEEFIQEFKSFASIEDAVKQTRTGLDVYRKVFGAECSGGKYGGWEYNQYADTCIDRSGFKWWCRDWMEKDASAFVQSAYYEPQFFGANNVIAMPSTLHGNRWTPRQVDALIADRQIIAVEEHMGALRPDGRIQTPNVFDDLERLRSLYRYLRSKNVWHATATQIADYFEVYQNSRVSDIGTDRFRLHYRGKAAGNPITLVIQPSQIVKRKRLADAILICPDGREIKGRKRAAGNGFIFSIAVLNGDYHYKEY